jgi:hypothetical protein
MRFFVAKLLPNPRRCKKKKKKENGKNVARGSDADRKKRKERKESGRALSIAVGNVVIRSWKKTHTTPQLVGGVLKNDNDVS